MSANAITFFNNLNLANKITLLRIVAIVPVLFLLSLPMNLFYAALACFIFSVAALSDIVDGYVARRDKSVTNFGKFLDPLADKLFICTVIIKLAALGWVSEWVAIIIIFRELAVTGLRAVAADEGIVIAADKYGKLKTIFQSAAIGPLIFHYKVLGIDVSVIGKLIMIIAVALTIYSGYRYFVNFYSSWTSTSILSDDIDNTEQDAKEKTE